VGTSGNTAVLSGTEAPAAERRLLGFLATEGAHKTLILRTLKDEFLTDPRVRRVVEVLRKASEIPEPIDFQGQIADLTDDERTFLSGIALSQVDEPTEKGVVQLLKALENRHLETRSSALQQAINRAQSEGLNTDDLVREKDRVQKRSAELNRKG
jgi:hypothetical protein